jgi:hypothetical protein
VSPPAASDMCSSPKAAATVDPRSPTALLSWFCDCQILADVQGSDHAPVVAELKVPQQLLNRGGEPPPLATKFMFTGRQTSLRYFLGTTRSSSGTANGAGSSRGSSQGVVGVPAAPVTAAAAGRGACVSAGGAAAPAGLTGWACRGGESSHSLVCIPAETGVIEGGVSASAAAPAAAAGVSSNSSKGGWAAGNKGQHTANGGPRQQHKKGSGGRKGGVGGQSSLWRFVQTKSATTVPPAAPASEGSRAVAAGEVVLQVGAQPSSGSSSIATTAEIRNTASPAGIPGNSTWDGPFLMGDCGRYEGPGAQGGSTGIADVGGGRAAAPAAAAGTPSGSLGLSRGNSIQQQQQQQLLETQLEGSSKAGELTWGEQPEKQQEQELVLAAAGGGRVLLQPSQQHQSAVQAWHRISNMMAPPKCKGHQEPCVIRTVKKKGENNGRQFYVCARPDGPPPVGRCDFFLWASQRVVKGSSQAVEGSRGEGGRRSNKTKAGGTGVSREQKRPRQDAQP